MSKTSLKYALGLTIRRSIIPTYHVSQQRLFWSFTALREKSSNQTPWYLRNEISQPESLKHKEPMPEIPENAPKNLERICKYLIDKLALTDLRVVDLRKTETNNPFGPETIMVVCSGKSDKHLSRACKDLLTWLRHENDVRPHTEGVLTAQLLRVRERRLKKRAERQSKYSGNLLSAYGSDNNSKNALKRTSSWIALDTKTDGIFLHLFAEDRRRELNLEEFWGNEFIEVEEKVVSPLPEKANRFERMFVQPTRQMHSMAISTPQFDISTETSISAMKKSIETVKRLTEETYQDPGIGAAINADSQMVKDTLQAFPYNANEELWRLKQVYLAYLRKLNPEAFPLSILTDNLLYQQASGIPVDEQDIKFTMERIVYDEATQTAFENENVDHRQRGKWRKHCDEILNSVLKLHEIAYRSTGKTMCVDNSILELLVAALIAPAKNAIRPADAVKDPTPVSSEESFGSMHIDTRLSRILEILNTQRYDHRLYGISKKTVTMVLSSYANGGFWSAFWSFWNGLVENLHVETDMRDLMVSLVVKSGAQTPIRDLLERRLPSLISSNDFSMTPEFFSAVNEGLKCIDPEAKKHTKLREFIGRYRNEETQ